MIMSPIHELFIEISKFIKVTTLSIEPFMKVKTLENELFKLQAEPISSL